MPFSEGRGRRESFSKTEGVILRQREDIFNNEGGIAPFFKRGAPFNNKGGRMPSVEAGMLFVEGGRTLFGKEEHYVDEGGRTPFVDEGGRIPFHKRVRRTSIKAGRMPFIE